jgi:hypothetical protein
MAKKRAETPNELIKYIKSVLSDKWRITVTEVDCFEHSPILGPTHSYFFSCSVYLFEPLKISATVFGNTIGLLAKAVDAELWNKIRDEFAKQKEKWSPNYDSLDSHQGQIGRKQLALTHTPQVSGN